MQELSPEELAEKNGRDGKPVYIAYQGKIYDVSQSKLWKTGTHMKRHPSGKDLTTDMGAAPHGAEVLDRYPQVGTVIKAVQPVVKLAVFLEPLFKKFPFLRRHPHPMTVHFPIAFMLAAPFFTILYLMTGNAGFEATAFYCLTAGTIFTPFVMLTGFISWQVNYMGRPMHAVNVKIVVSLLMLVVSIAAFRWRQVVPDILTNFRALSIIYLLLILSLFPMVAVIGWFGAKMTFPLEEE